MKLYQQSTEIIKTQAQNSLWLGDINSAMNFQWIRKNNIRTVITAVQGFSLNYGPSIRHYKYMLQDRKDQNILKYFDEVVQKITKSLRFGSTLVHCGAGISRSTTLVLAYLIKQQKMTFRKALEFIKSKRPKVCPNIGYQLQLKSYDTLVNHTMKTKLSNGLISQLEHQSLSLPEIRRQKKLNSVESRENVENHIDHEQKLRYIFQNKVTAIQKISPQYLKKIAAFRFGVTNLGKWNLK